MIRSRHHRVVIDRPFSGSGVSVYAAPAGQLRYRTAVIRSAACSLAPRPATLTTRVANVPAIAGGSVDVVIPIDPAWEEQLVDVDVRPYANGYERVAEAPRQFRIEGGQPTNPVNVTAAVTRNETRAGGRVLVVIQPDVTPASTAVAWRLRIAGQPDTPGVVFSGRVRFATSLPDGTYSADVIAVVNATETVVETIDVTADGTGPALVGVTGEMQ